MTLGIIVPARLPQHKFGIRSRGAKFVSSACGPLWPQRLSGNARRARAPRPQRRSGRDATRSTLLARGLVRVPAKCKCPAACSPPRGSDGTLLNFRGGSPARRQATRRPGGERPLPSGSAA